MRKSKLEKKIIKEFFKNLDRAIVCSVQQCPELGKHFRCYDLSYDKCSLYVVAKRKR